MSTRGVDGLRLVRESNARMTAALRNQTRLRVPQRSVASLSSNQLNLTVPVPWIEPYSAIVGALLLMLHWPMCVPVL